MTLFMTFSSFGLRKGQNILQTEYKEEVTIPVLVVGRESALPFFMALVRPAFLFGILKDNSGRTSLY
jgi:hypothetical protein